MRKIQTIMISLLVVLSLASCTSRPQYPIASEVQQPNGTIFFRTFNLPNPSHKYGFFRSFLVSMPERSIQRMGYDNENNGQAISKDGKLIALTCEYDQTSICILNTAHIINKILFVPDSNVNGYGYIWWAEVRKISLPKECVDLDELGSSHQMSWSFDNSKLSIVCGKKLTQTLLCIVEIDGESTCYPETMEKKIIFADWSPIADSLAVSSSTYGTTIPTTYIFDPETGDMQFLFAGFAPAWSPSGNSIASFIINQNDPKIFYYGLQVYSVKEKKNVTLLPNENSKKIEFSVWPTVDESEDILVIG
jgi:hypothetical protein